MVLMDWLSDLRTRRSGSRSRRMSFRQPVGQVEAFEPKLLLSAASGSGPQAELGKVSGALTEGSTLSITGFAADSAGSSESLTYTYEVFKGTSSTAVDGATGVDLHTFDFTPDDDGSYTIVLTVEDPDGNSSSVSRTIAVRNVGPVIDLGDDSIVQEGDTILLDLTNITDPGDDTISSIAVDWGDGTTSTYASASVVDHVYADGPGELTIRVTLIDEDGVWTSAPRNAVSSYLDTLDSLTQTLIARYELDGDVEDTAGSADGISVGAPVYGEGLIRDSLTANHGRYGWVQPGTAFVPGNSTFSTSMHFKLDAMNDPLSWAPLIVMQDGDFSEGVLFAISSTRVSGDTVTLFMDGGPAGAPDRQTLTYVAEESLLGEWHQAGYRIDRAGDSVDIIFNGKIVASESLTVSSIDSTKGLFLGQYDFRFGRNGHPRFVGGNDMHLDDVLIFDKALAESDYEALNLTAVVPFEKNVRVLNAAPIVESVSSPEIDENGIAVLTGVFSDGGSLDTHVVEVTWGDGSSSRATVDPGSRTFRTSRQFLDDARPGTPSDAYTVQVTITDDDGDTATTETTLIVNNVAPEFRSLESSHNDACQSSTDGAVRIEGMWSDVGTLDTHRVIVNWGDGGASETLTSVDQGADSFSARHQYESGGMYVVTVTVIDDDGGEVARTVDAVVQGVGVVGETLYVIGTDGRDHVHLSEKRGVLRADVRFAGGDGRVRTHYDVTTVSGIVVTLCGGSDHVLIKGHSNIPVTVDAGAGDDHVTTGDGDDTIIGGPGDDWIRTHGGNDVIDGGTGRGRVWAGDGDDKIRTGDEDDWIDAGAGHDQVLGRAGDDVVFGGEGNDFLIGGTGADVIHGGKGDDLLIAGSTLWDTDPTALEAIFAEWTSNVSYMERVQHLRDGTGSRLSGVSLNAGTTVKDDGDRDLLNGGRGRDYFFAAVTDYLPGRKRDEFWDVLTES